MFYLAMSCLQTRPQHTAFADLTYFEPHGIQLTPGNLPSPNFEKEAKAWQGKLRFHHSFSWKRYRQPVYDKNGNPLLDCKEWSVHPPQEKEFPFDLWLAQARKANLIVETMYPGYLVGNEEQLNEILKQQFRVAVDISHLKIMRCQKKLSTTLLNRLLNYDKIAEIHISDNDGNRDQHRPICKETPWLAWAKEKMQQGTPTIYESYLHRLSEKERWQQIALVRS